MMWQWCTSRSTAATVMELLGKTSSQAVEVMGRRRNCAEMHQPGLEGLLHGLLHPEAPGAFAKDAMRSRPSASESTIE
jgi:hypothetical protein